MDDEEKLKLGKGMAFVKSRLKRLPQDDDTWEADFEALPQPIKQSGTHYLGMVVEKQDGWFLAELTVPGRPTINDLATLLAHAMRRPRAGIAHRPKVIRLREHHQWRELFPALKELGHTCRVTTYDDSGSHQESLAHALPTSHIEDPDLALIVGLWDRLADQCKRVLIEMVRANTPSED